MLLIFPIAVFLLFFEALRRKKVDWRRAVLASAVFWAACVVGINETLSVGHHLTRGSVAVSWALICVVILLCLHRIGTGAAPVLNSRTRADGGFSLAEWDLSTKSLLTGVGIIVLLVGITAVVSAPNMWDAMEYHLPRVVMWMSNHSVQFYPTPDYSQLIFGPWAEYAMMHAYLLWGSDRFVNLVEFLSYIGSLIGVSLIAKMLGAGVRGQMLAVVVCATIPEGVLEASGPMNTYVVSFWIATTTVFLMSWNEDPNLLNTTTVGLSAGLAVLTKGIAYPLLPFLVLAGWLMGSSTTRLLFLNRSPVFVLLILALNAPHYFRCYELTNSPLGLPLRGVGPRVQLTMEHVSVQGTLANVLRNLSLHLGTPSEGLNLRIERVFRFAIGGIGANPDDPQAIWLGEPYHLNHFSSDEGIAGNPLHLAMLVVCILLVLYKHKSTENGKASWYALGIASAFLLFSALLKWQAWSGRYQTPLFVLGSALTGLVLERYFSRKVATAVTILFLAVACLFALVNKTRSLVPWRRVSDVYHPRSVLYFSHLHQKDAPAFLAAAEVVNQSNCRSVAIDAYTNALELKHSPKSFYIYPLFPLIHFDGRTRTVWYTGVHNLTQRYANELEHNNPCAVVCVDCAKEPEKWLAYQDMRGAVSVFDYIVVFTTRNERAKSETMKSYGEQATVGTQ
jgi:hypothetical protein